MKSKKVPEEQNNHRKRMHMKPKAGNSFSISKRRNSFTTVAKQHPPQEKTWRKETAIQMDESSSTFTNTKSSTSVAGEDESETMEIVIASCMDDDEWETETSIEMMRSAELTSVDESVIPPPESFRDKDIASLVFLSESYCPIAYSTPRFFPDGKSLPFSVNLDSLKEAAPHASPTMKSNVITRHEEIPTIPNVSFENEFAKEKDSLEDEDFQLKPITPEKNLVLPDIADDTNPETQEQREGAESEMKSISPEQSVQLPVVPDTVSYENQEQSEGRPESNETDDPILSPFKKRDDGERRGRPESNETEHRILSPFKKRDDGESRDSIIFREAPFSAGSDTSQDSDASTVPNHSIADIEVPYYGDSDTSHDSDVSTEANFDEDQDNSENNPLETVVNESTNSNPRKRNQEAEPGNLFEDKDDYRNGEDFSKFRNLKIDFSEKKRKGYKVKNRMDECLTRWKQRHEGVNYLEYKSDSEDNFENFQKIQTTELEDNESVNNQPQTAAPQIKSGVNVSVGADKKRQREKGASFLNRLQNSISLRKKHTNDGKDLFEGKNDNEDSFETVENVQNENFQDFESVNNQQEYATSQKTKKRIKYASIPSKSNSNQKRKNVNKIVSYSEDVDDYSRLDNFEKNETPKRKGRLCKRSKLKFSKRIKTSRRRKHRNEGENFFKDIGMNDRDGTFETDQNEQNELQDIELDTNQPETSTYQTKRKNNKCVGTVDIMRKDANIINGSQSKPSLKENHRNEEENWFEDMGMTVSEVNFEHFQNEPQEEFPQDDESDHNMPETSAHQIKRKNSIHVGSDDNVKQQNPSISNKSQSSAHRRRNHENEGESTFGDLDKRDNVKNSENIQGNRNDSYEAGNSSKDAYNRIYDFEGDDMEVNTSKKKRKPHRSVGIKRSWRVNRSRKAANCLNRLRNSTSREVSLGPQSRENEAVNANWPRCCIEASSYLGRTFRVLSPVFHDDYPIDSITLLSYNLMGSKEKCNH